MPFSLGWNAIKGRFGSGICTYTGASGGHAKTLCNIPASTHAWKTPAQLRNQYTRIVCAKRYCNLFLFSWKIRLLFFVEVEIQYILLTSEIFRYSWKLLNLLFNFHDYNFDHWYFSTGKLTVSYAVFGYTHVWALKYHESKEISALKSFCV